MSTESVLIFLFEHEHHPGALSMLSAPLSSDPARIPARKPPICDFFALSSGLYMRQNFPKTPAPPTGLTLYGRSGNVKPAERALDFFKKICYNYKKTFFKPAPHSEPTRSHLTFLKNYDIIYT